jgi:hypothetical protein
MSGDRASSPGLLRKLGRLRAADWSELAVATVALARARWDFGRLPDRDILAMLQQPSRNPDARRDADPDAVRIAPDLRARLMRLSWALTLAARYLPWRTDCLIQCLAARSILDRRGLGHEFFIGARRDVPGGFLAHAWMGSSGVPIVGGTGEGFDVILGQGPRG